MDVLRNDQWFYLPTRRALVLVFLLLGLLTTQTAQASHITGGQITYVCNSLGNYQVTLKLYRDCSGSSLGTSAVLTATSPTCGTQTINMTQVGMQTDITPVCGSAVSSCNGGTQTGIEEYVYTGTFTLPTGCDDWEISYQNCCRNSVTTLTSQDDFYVSTLLDNTVSPCNNSPVFNTTPTPFVCVNTPVTYSHGASDPDGDSLRFSLVDCRGTSTTIVSYSSPYSGTNPLQTASGTTIDPATGNITFTPTVAMNGVLCVLVEEYRNNIKVGEIVRDIQFNVLSNCNNDPPELSGVNNTTSYTISGCVGQTINFDLYSSDVNTGDVVTLALSNSIPNSTFTTTSGSRPVGTFSWSPTINDIGNHLFTVEVVDDACPLVGRNTYTYTIQILPNASNLNVSISTTDPSCNNACDGQATATITGGTGNYSYLWSSGETTPTATQLCPGAGTVEVTDNGGCSQVFNFTINNPPVLGATVTSNDVSCNGATDGTVSASVSGGNAPYTYQWQSTATSSLPNAASLSNLPTGQYFVTVTDATGCAYTGNTNVGTPSNVTMTFAVTDVSCFGTANGQITPSVTGGNGGYSYVWSDGATTATRSGLPGGTYSLTVTDVNGCQATGSAIVQEPTLLTANTSSSDVTCVGGNDGTANVSPSGGTPPYSYSWSNGATTASISGLSANSYSVTITDANGCTRIESLNVGQPTAITLTAVATSPSCLGGYDGTIDLSPSGGTPPYTFQWSSSLPNTEDQTGLSAGIYTVIILDANGCNITRSIQVTDPATPLSDSLVATGVICSGGRTGAINHIVTGGTPPYSYAWSDGSSAQNLLSVSAGTYSVTTTDVNGCTITNTATVTEPSELLVSGSIGNAILCNTNCNGAIDLAVSGGTQPYTYAWSDPNIGNTEDPTGLCSGVYSVTVTDANGCFKVENVNLAAPNLLEIFVDTVQNIACNGDRTGFIRTTTIGGVGNYVYLWSNGAGTTANPNNLPAGNYSVTVVDDNGCSATASTSISEPSAIQVTSTTSSVSCFGGSDGNIDLTVTGGVGPYAFVWNNGVSPFNIEDPTGLSAGTYTVKVTDRNDCEVFHTVVIGQPSPLNITAIPSDVSCYQGSDGAIATTTSGGTPPYTYQWSNNNGTAANLTGMQTGNYSVTVTDANGCIAITAASIGEPPILTTALTTQDPDCFNGANGTASITASGGNGNYAYTWSNGNGNNATASNLSAGFYSVTTTDNKGCTRVDTFTLFNPSRINITAAITDASCEGASDGAIDLTIAGGQTPYTVGWSNSLPNTQDQSGLSAGTYTVTVTDNLGCVQTTSFVVGEPVLLTSTISRVNASCASSSDGSISLTANGGTSPYTFSWSNGSPLKDQTNLAPGSYTVTITDANGCTTTNTATISAPPALLLNTQIITPIACKGDCNGAINLIVQGGTPPYSYAWSGGLPNTEDQTAVCAGIYTVTVTDALGCSQVIGVTLAEPNELSVALDQATSISCGGGSDGAIDVTTTGGTAPYSYLWSGTSATTEDLYALSAGTYGLVVVDANGCTDSLTVTLTEPTPLSITSTQVDIDCHGNATGSIDLTVTGGMMPYIYQWSSNVNLTSIEDPSSLSAGLYTVTVTDANGCTITHQVTLTEPQPLLVTLSGNDLSCFGGADGNVVSSITGGTAPYVYQWNNNLGTSPNLLNVPSGRYTTTVTDAQGCQAIATITLEEPDPLFASISTIDPTCAGGADGTATVSPTGGTAPYSFVWSSGSGNNATATNLPQGSYIVTVTDNNGCQYVDSFQLVDPQPLGVTAAITDVSCNGLQDGAIDIEVSGGQAPYTYSWLAGLPSTQDQSGLFAGRYSVTVTDANGCSETLVVTVVEPTVISLSANATNPSCFGGSDGAIDLTATGGTGAFHYLWSDGTLLEDPANLPAGTHSVTVTDGSGCTASLDVTLGEPTRMQVNHQVIDVNDCFGDCEADINLVVTGGSPSYTFAWDQGLGTVEDPMDVCAGVYLVTVTDSKGCRVTHPVTITQPDSLVFVAIDSTDLDCSGVPTGAITTQTTGGTPPMSYSWSNNGGSQASPTQLFANSYKGVAVDALGCTDSVFVTIEAPQPLIITSTQVNILCNGLTNGRADLTVTGGVPPYAYSWSTGVTPSNVEDPVGLSAGTYTVTVTDANGCTATHTITITEPMLLTATAIATDVACYGDSTGAVNTTIAGGTYPYQYQWNTGDTTQNLTGLVIGQYIVTVTDANGCRRIASAYVGQPAILSSQVATEDILCHGALTGKAKVTASGGVSPFTYTWSNGANNVDSVGNLGAGTHYVTITDANSCEIIQTVNIYQPLALNLTTAVTDISCFDADDGAVDLSVSGGRRPYQYQWSNGATTQDLSGLMAGNYTVTVTDANGCTATTLISITEPFQLSTSIVTTHVDCPGNATGFLDLTVNGGTAPYAFSWSTGVQLEDVGSLVAGRYYVTVTDARGCVAFDSATITQPIPLSLQLAVRDSVTCFGSSDGAINTTITGGVLPYTFTWSTGIGNVEDPANLVAGTYLLTVTDANGCIITGGVTLRSPMTFKLALRALHPFRGVAAIVMAQSM